MQVKFKNNFIFSFTRTNQNILRYKKMISLESDERVLSSRFNALVKSYFPQLEGHKPII